MKSNSKKGVLVISKDKIKHRPSPSIGGQSQSDSHLDNLKIFRNHSEPTLNRHN